MARTAKINKGYHGFPIEISLNLDGTGVYNIDTGIGFFDHLLELFSKHSLFDITIKCSADIDVDDHHLVDEVGIVLGNAFKMAIDNDIERKNNRYGFYVLPMDEALTTAAVDLCGRSSFIFDLTFHREFLGELSTEMIKEFWYLFSQKAMINFIVKSEYGENDHHVAEGLFKCVARSLKMAVGNPV